MKKQLFDLTIEEFTRILLDYPERLEFQINEFDENGKKTEKEPDTLVGTYKELNRIAEDFAPDNPVRTSIQRALSTHFDYDMQLNKLDIYNYLEHITSNFHEERVRIVLNEMDCFYQMVYLEDIDSDVQKQYIEKGWEIPTIEINLNKIGAKIEGKEAVTVPDYKAMREKIYLCRGFMYHNAIGLLKRKLQSDEPTSPIYFTTKKGEKTDFIRIINAMYELSFFIGKDGTNISKKCVFEEFGKLVNLDFTDYQNLLSKANKGCNTDGNSQQNRIFERLKEVSMKKEK